MASYDIFDIQIADRFNSKTLISTGGKAIVCLNSAPYVLATLYNPDSDFASLSQPVSLTRGKLRFAIARSATATQPASVDVYGTAPSGHGFRGYAVKPSDPAIIRIDTGDPRSHLVLPFSFAQGVVASVVDLGLDLPAGALVDPFPWIDVKAIDATETIDVGLLASESGGDEDGFLAAADIGTLGVVRGKNASTATTGALLRESQDAAATNTPRPHLIAAAVSVTWTMTTGSDTGTGRIVVPYMVAVTG